MEKKNKAERARKKKEDNARLRKIIDQALKNDPRIQIFKEKEKEAKNAKRYAREKEERERKEAERLEQLKQQQLKEEAERLEKQAKEDAKKDKDSKKKAVKKEKKLLKTILKDNAYLTNGAPADFLAKSEAERIDLQLDRLEIVFAKCGDDLEDFRVKLEKAIAEGCAYQLLESESAK